MLKVHSFKGGFDDNFCHVVWDAGSKEAAVIDTAIEPDRVLRFIAENQLKLRIAVVMHMHADHTVGLQEYRDQGVKLAASELHPGDIDIVLKDGDKIRLGGYSLKVLHTPGHTADGICLLVDGKLFTSDTLFIDGCGRCDLGGSDVDKMHESLQRIKELPDETVVYPGHDYGPSPTALLGEQKKTNKYLLAEGKEEFVRLRM